MSSRHYAGDFECVDCRRKRLTAASFSKTMANKKRSNPDAPLRCLECVAKRAEEERAAAVEKSLKAASIQSSGEDGGQGDGELLECSACKQNLAVTSFSSKQRRKETGARCNTCIATSEATERSRVEKAKLEKLQEAQGEAAAAAGGTAISRVHAAANETAEEARFVTGLKPVKLGRGRGSWRARARGQSSRGRGRGAIGRGSSQDS